MEKVKISLISTVLNEEKSIASFLDTILEQKQKPDEVIIVDGGSTDQTIRTIKKYKDKFSEQKINLKVSVKKDATRSEGRNAAIKLATGNLIAVSDAGCLLDKNWLLEITKPFLKKEVKAAAGYYLPKTETIFQKCIAPFFCVMPDKTKETKEFLPSSRSFAFRKEVWQEVGGYPDELNYCEDLVFDQKLKKAGYKFYFAPKAIVYWPQRKNLSSAFRQTFNYAFGDGQVFFSQYHTHNRKILSLILRYFLAFWFFVFGLIFQEIKFIFFVAVLFYLLLPIFKYYRYVKNWRATFWLPTIKIAFDLAIIGGSVAGVLSRGF